MPIRDNIRPGDSVQVILEPDMDDHVKKGTVYEVDGKRILLSQTSPPLSDFHRGLHAQVAFAVRGKNGPEQRAFMAAIAGFLPRYEISSSQIVPAVILEQLTSSYAFNRRTFVRVKPVRKSGLAAICGVSKLTVIDISLVGARLSASEKPRMEMNDKVSIKFIFDTRWFDVDATVVKVTAKTGLHYVSVQFAPDQKEFEHHLGRKLLMIQREQLARDW
jgi:hypothetical protein